MDLERLPTLPTLCDFSRLESTDILDALRFFEPKLPAASLDLVLDTKFDQPSFSVHTEQPLHQSESDKNSEVLHYDSMDEGDVEGLQCLVSVGYGHPENQRTKRARTSTPQRKRSVRLCDFLDEDPEYDFSGSDAERLKHTPSRKRKANSFSSQGKDAEADSLVSGDDEDDKARQRREKNRIAARKCRAKKMQSMIQMENRVQELAKANEEMRVQLLTLNKMFSREVKLREAMKVIIQARWNSTTPFNHMAISANDVLIALEAGTMDINTLLAMVNNPPPTPRFCAPGALGGVNTMVGCSGMNPLDQVDSFLQSFMSSEDLSTSTAGVGGLPGVTSITSQSPPPSPYGTSRMMMGNCITTGAGPTSPCLSGGPESPTLPVAAGGGDVLNVCGMPSPQTSLQAFL